MDINVHAFGYMARSGLQSIFRDFQDFILECWFTVEIEVRRGASRVRISGCFDLNPRKLQRGRALGVRTVWYYAKRLRR